MWVLKGISVQPRVQLKALSAFFSSARRRVFELVAAAADPAAAPLTLTEAAEACGCKMTQYTMLHRMGKGSYGKVYKALGPDGLVAIKMVPAPSDNDAQKLKDIQGEIDTLKSCAGHWVVPLREMIYGSDSFSFVLECADLGSILDIMNRQVRHARLDA